MVNLKTLAAGRLAESEKSSLSPFFLSFGLGGILI